MVDKSIVARQHVSSSLGLDGEHVEKRYGVLRPVDSWLGKFLEDVEEAVPQAAGVLDVFFGAKPEQEIHTAQWWAEGRPRPHRGKSADPSIAAAKTAKVRDAQAAAAAKSASASAAASAAAAAAEAKAENQQQMKELTFAIAETQKRRLGFFGRPVQKCRLGKIRKEIERQSHQHQCSMFAHLQSDAEAELDLQTSINKAQRDAKNKAAANAAAYRAEERGARVAAAGFKPLGAQLKDAMLKALEAAENYEQKAEQEEAKARKAKKLEEKAYELMQQEEEKIRFCMAQVRAERAVAKRMMLQLSEFEKSEILALVAEQRLLAEFSDVWRAKIKVVPKGSPAHAMVTSQIDLYDLRQDVVSMEMRMYEPTFLKPAANTFSVREGVTPLTLDYYPQNRDIEWVFRKQFAKDGMIGLAKGAVGPELKYRMKIVQTLGEKEHPEIDLPEDACDSIFEHKDGVVVRTDFLEDDENPLLEYLTREKKEAREEHLTKMTKEIFQRLWSQDPRHEVKINRTLCSAKLRHRPDFKWCSQWIVSDPESKDFILKNSYVLGPQKLPYATIRAPQFHAKDKPNDVKDSMGVPRRYARIGQWYLEAGSWVNKGDRLISFRVYEPSLVHPKTNPNGRFPPTYPSPQFKDNPGKQQEEKEHIEAAMKMFDGEWLDDDSDDEAEDRLSEQCQAEVRTDRKYITERMGKSGPEKAKPQLLVFRSVAEGLLTGLVREPGSKICSFDEMAFLDPGEVNWQKTVCPVAEWPPEFFS